MDARQHSSLEVAEAALISSRVEYSEVEENRLHSLRIFLSFSNLALRLDLDADPRLILRTEF